MIWFLALLVIFWKPIYYLVRYAIAVKNSNSTDRIYYWGEFITWFTLLWILLKPTQETKNATESKRSSESPQSNA